MRKKTDFFRIEMLALKALESQDRYGFEISQMIAEKTDNLFQIREGSLYPVLYKLEEKHYIYSYPVKISPRQVRVYYRLKEEGREYLKELYDYYQQSILALEHFMEGKES